MFLRSQNERSYFTERVAKKRTGSVLVLNEVQRRRRLEDFGIQAGMSQFVRNASEAEALMEDRREYAIKIVSPDISHKSDVGGVRLRATKGTAHSEFARLLASVRENVPTARLEGFSVASMARPWVEFIIGAYHDENFGPCVVDPEGSMQS